MSDRFLRDDDDIRKCIELPVSSEPDQMDVSDDGSVLNENVDSEADGTDMDSDFIPSDESASPLESDIESENENTSTVEDVEMVSVNISADDSVNNSVNDCASDSVNNSVGEIININEPNENTLGLENTVVNDSLVAIVNNNEPNENILGLENTSLHENHVGLSNNITVNGDTYVTLRERYQSIKSKNDKAKMKREELDKWQPYEGKHKNITFTGNQINLFNLPPNAQPIDFFINT